MRPVHPNAIERRDDAARSRVRAMTVGLAVNLFLRFAANNHSVFASNRAHEAFPAVAAIMAASSAVVPLDGAAAASRVASEGARNDVLEHPSPARRALAAFPCRPSHSRRLLKFCPQGQILVVVR